MKTFRIALHSYMKARILFIVLISIFLKLNLQAQSTTAVLNAKVVSIHKIKYYVVLDVIDTIDGRNVSIISAIDCNKDSLLASGSANKVGIGKVYYFNIQRTSSIKVAKGTILNTHFAAIKVREKNIANEHGVLYLCTNMCGPYIYSN